MMCLSIDRLVLCLHSMAIKSAISMNLNAMNFYSIDLINNYSIVLIIFTINSIKSRQINECRKE